MIERQKRRLSGDALLGVVYFMEGGSILWMRPQCLRSPGPCLLSRLALSAPARVLNSTPRIHERAGIRFLQADKSGRFIRHSYYIMATHESSTTKGAIMSAYKDSARNTWFVKFRYTDWQGNRKETTRRGFATKRDAKAFEEEFKRKAQSNPEMTFQSLYEIYYDDMRQHNKETSIINIDNTVKRHMLPILGQIPIAEITPNVVRKWQNALNNYTNKGRPLKPTSIQNINRRLSTILNFAVKFYGLPKNPMHVTGSQGKSEKRIEFWSKEEFDIFIDAIEHPMYKAIFLVLFYSGMRIGEALALTTDDVDFEVGKIFISKTLSAYGKITPPKTESSNRTIILPASVNQYLLSVVRKLEITCGRIFPTNYNNVLYHFRQSIKASGVRPLKIHCLRHAHASLLIAQGVPITAISKRLGHTSPKITLSIYSHATSDSDENIANLLDTL